MPPSKDLADLELGAALAPTAEHIRKGAWAKAAKAADAALAGIEKSGRLDDLLAVQALRGRARAKLGDTKRATTAFKAALDAYKPASLDAIGPADAPETIERLRVMVEAVSEARFFFAEEKRKAAEAEKLPAYRGNGTKDDVLKFVNGPFAKWFKARNANMVDVERAYVEVLDVQPAPSPRWVVRSAERVGAFSSSFATAVDRAPYPKEWEGEGDIAGIPKADILATYKRALADVTSPMQQRARAAYKTCVDRAAAFSVDLPEVALCKKWLDDNPAPPKTP